MRHLALLAPLALAAALLPAAAAAMPAAVPATTVWLCGLSDDLTRIVCIADSTPADPDAAADAPPGRATGVVHGTRFPLDTRRQWTVDLWSPATDAAAVAELARATLCWRTPACEVLMHTSVLDRTDRRARR